MGKKSKSRRNNRRRSSNKRKRRKSRRRRRRRRRRSQRGGGAVVGASPKGPFLAPYTWADPFPPGGAYKAGDINGLGGGYYYPEVMNPYLPDPHSTVGEMGVPQKGGRRSRKHRHSRNCNCFRKNRRSRRRRRRRGRRRNQRGGGVASLVKSFLPSDVIDVGRSVGYDLRGWFDGYLGEKPPASPNVTDQPLDISSKMTKL